MKAAIIRNTVWTILSIILPSYALSETPPAATRPFYPSHVEAKRPSFLYFGPEFIRLDTTSSLFERKYTGTNNYLGLRFGYDIVKPYAPYFGISFFASYDKNSIFNYRLPGEEPMAVTGKCYFANGEFRAGYTFGDVEATSTLFLGLGTFSLSFPQPFSYIDSIKYQNQEILSYATAGMKISREFTPSVRVGCNVQAILTFYLALTGAVFENNNAVYIDFEQRLYKKTWGGQIGFPFSWHPFSQSDLHIEIEPSYLYLLKEKGSLKGYGLRFLIGAAF